MNWRTVLSSSPLFFSIAFLTGCPSEEVSLECEMPPYIETQDGPDGQGGTNGLNATQFHENAYVLLKMATFPLREPMTDLGDNEHYQLSTGIEDSLLAIQDVTVRKEIMNHALQCAMPARWKFISGNTEYSGAAVDGVANLQDPDNATLATTADWLDGPLKPDAVSDLFTCMSILLNPQYKNVPVYLSGPSVHSYDPSGEVYPFEEAVWQANVSLPDGIIRSYRVWPLYTGSALAEVCDTTENLRDSFQFRICGGKKDNCNIDVRENLFEEECAPDSSGHPGHFLCKVGGTTAAMPAIMTRLRSQCDMAYVSCPLLPQ